jgi:hypothetical protein
MAYNLVKQYFKKFDIIYFILIFNYNKLGKETQASSLTQSQPSITSNSIISLPLLRVPPNLTIYAFHYPQKALTCQIPISPSLSISSVIHLTTAFRLSVKFTVTGTQSPKTMTLSQAILLPLISYPK